MEQSIGEYANQVFKNLMTKIKEINDPAEEVSEKIKLIANEIELIDDPIIKGKVFDYFEEMTIENKRKEIIQQKIARLENEITSYKKELTDDKLR